MFLADRVLAAPNGQQVFSKLLTLELLDLSDLDLNLGGPVYHNKILNTLNIHSCSLRIGKVFRLPVAVSLDVLHKAALQITLTALEVVDIENRVTSNQPFLLNLSSIAKMQS